MKKWFDKECKFSFIYSHITPRRKKSCLGHYKTVNEASLFCPNCSRLAARYKAGGDPGREQEAKQKSTIKVFLTYRQFQELTAEKIAKLGVHGEDYLIS